MCTFAPKVTDWAHLDSDPFMKRKHFQIRNSPIKIRWEMPWGEILPCGCTYYHQYHYHCRCCCYHHYCYIIIITVISSSLLSLFLLLLLLLLLYYYIAILLLLLLSLSLSLSLLLLWWIRGPGRLHRFDSWMTSCVYAICRLKLSHVCRSILKSLQHVMFSCQVIWFYVSFW